MSTESILQLFDKGGYALILMSFILYFAYRYLTITLEQFKRRIESDLLAKQYELRAKFHKTDIDGEYNIQGQILEIRVTKST